MSASSWTTCPQCGGAWREDYEILGAEDGMVEVSYRGICTGHLLPGPDACGAKLSFADFHVIKEARK
jgi:hypothetical protein